MKDEFINEEWQLLVSSERWERAEAKKVNMIPYQIMTFRKDFWSIHYKRNGELKKNAKKEFGMVCCFFSYSWQVKIIEQLVTQHNAWIIRNDEEKTREYIKTEIQWHTQRVFKSMIAHETRSKHGKRKSGN